MSAVPSEVTHSESHSSDNTPEKPGSLWIVWVAVGLLLIYPLSIGPMAKFYEGRRAPAGVEIFYWPIAALYSSSPAVHKSLDSYFHLWGVRT